MPKIALRDVSKTTIHGLKNIKYMIRVGFTIIDGKVNWMGGINYLKNLLYAISQLEEKKIQPVLFLGNNIDNKIIQDFKDLAEIHQDSLFDRKSSKWIVYTFLRDVFKRNPAVNQIVEKYNIDAFSHSFIYGPDINCIKINWIPDFQHVHLPKLYSKLHLLVRDYRLRSLARYSDIVILSSYDALNDYKKFTPEYTDRARVIHFVSQTTSFEDKGAGYIKEKYKIKGRYFFLPNQFWAHKNHKVVFEAIKLAIETVPDITLICSGHLNDDRNVKHIIELKTFIEKNKLQGNIVLLGLIPFGDVLLLMKYSISIINPSYFEGWSSTVEESKSMGRNLILSDIPVHREQAPHQVVFFHPDKPVELADILIEKWEHEENIEQRSNIKEDDLTKRTIDFGGRFQSIILESTEA
ncbi:glycosyltransferase family 4 protein [Mucilaginibacter sp. FT3.2]|uniref:glycosyltransferase family 4 protein n=1 Tax=Mucilaginibacter sp. FT3.2 TaxID=2723090 RepID=UPI001615F0D0|nr:glycosyltransferase family 1 protein [Mucilaginibacter sp. FT3.2]MBB6230160.1 glycosyltransferase involved in cell wall biosynthesis [Mucilaginibacter sp. FT3.2]